MELEDILRERDFRLTRPRRVVWEVLSESERHLSAAEIAELVAAGYVDLDGERVTINDPLTYGLKG